MTTQLSCSFNLSWCCFQTPKRSSYRLRCAPRAVTWKLWIIRAMICLHSSCVIWSGAQTAVLAQPQWIYEEQTFTRCANLTTISRWLHAIFTCLTALIPRRRSAFRFSRVQLGHYTHSSVHEGIFIVVFCIESYIHVFIYRFILLCCPKVFVKCVFCVASKLEVLTRSQLYC